MDCPDCSHDRTRVVDTGTTDSMTVRRRRECQRCSFRFTTYERPEWETLQVKKRDGRIESFTQSKLRAGIERAVEKRPVDDDTVTDLVDRIETRLRDRDTRIISATAIGDLTSQELRSVDKVATSDSSRSTGPFPTPRSSCANSMPSSRPNTTMRPAAGVGHYSTNT